MKVDRPPVSFTVAAWTFAEVKEDRRVRRELLADFCRLGRNGFGVEQVRRHDCHVRGVAGHVAEGSGAKVQPASPLERRVDRVVGSIRSWSEEEIPVQSLWNFFHVFRATFSLWPDRSVGPDMNFLNFTKHTSSDDFDSFTKSVVGRSLVAHLSRDAFFVGHVAHQLGFVDRPGQRLLSEAVFAHAHGQKARGSVAVIRSRNRDGINLVAHLGEHFPVVDKLLGVGISSSCFLESFLIDIADGDHVSVVAGISRVARTFAFNADRREVDLF